MEIDHSKNVPWTEGQRIVLASYDSDDGEMVRLDNETGTVLSCDEDIACIELDRYGKIECDPYYALALKDA